MRPEPDRSRPTIELPADPLLRALAVYGALALVAIVLTQILIRLAGLPAWLNGFIVSLLVLGAPVVATGAWLRDRRR